MIKNFEQFINEGIISMLGLTGYEEGYFNVEAFSELNNIGFVGFKNNDCAMIYRPNIEDTLEYIAVISMRKILPGPEGIIKTKYIVKVHLASKKVIKDSFTDLDELIKFVKQYIPDIDSDIKNYNL